MVPHCHGSRGKLLKAINYPLPPYPSSLSPTLSPPFPSLPTVPSPGTLPSSPGETHLLLHPLSDSPVWTSLCPHALSPTPHSAEVTPGQDKWAVPRGGWEEMAIQAEGQAGAKGRMAGEAHRAGGPGWKAQPGRVALLAPPAKREFCCPLPQLPCQLCPWDLGDPSEKQTLLLRVQGSPSPCSPPPAPITPRRLPPFPVGIRGRGQGK